MSANFLDSLRTLFKLSGTQALPSKTLHSTQTGTSTQTVYVDMVSPVDGWLEGRNTAYNPAGGVSKLRFCSQDNQDKDAISFTCIRQDISGVGVVSGHMPVQKGQKIKWLCTEGVTYEIYWYATKGGSD